MREAGRKAAAVAAAVGIVASAACGGGGNSRLSKADYEKKLKAEGAALRSDLAGLNLSGATNVKALAPKLGKAQTQVEQTASEIDDLKPPADAAVDNNKIAHSLHGFAKVFGQMEGAAAKGDRAKLASYVPGLQSAAQEGSQATQDLKSKGYDIGEFGR
jgi:hypothetical protein